MATLRRLSYTVINIWCPYVNIAKIAYTVINIWCPYGNIAKIVLYRYKYLMSIWQHCEDRLIPL